MTNLYTCYTTIGRWDNCLQIWELFYYHFFVEIYLIQLSPIPRTRQQWPQFAQVIQLGEILYL